MKKQLVSILFALCMVLCLVPLAAFAEGETENVQVVADQTTLVAAMADTSVTTVKLAADIDIDATLKVDRTVTLDLNGQVLKYVGESKGSVIVVEDGGNLTLMDSNDEKVHNFDKSVMPWALAADDATGENIVAVPGGVITGGTGHPYQLYSTVNCGGGVYIAPGGQLTMTGGNIIGCSAKYGGGVCIYPKQDSKQGQFSMSGGSIIGCSAESGGGVCAFGKFQMSGQAVIRSCTAEGTSFYFGGGVWVDGSFEMSGEAIIEGCQAISEYAYGGGVYVNSSSSFVMSGKAKIERCQAISTPSSPSKGGGVHLANNTTLTLSGSAVIQNCTATNSANSGEAYGGGVSAANVREITLEGNAQIFQCDAANGSGLYITGSQMYPADYGKLLANGGSVEGDVVLGEADNPCTVIGSGRTVFKGKVTVTPGSTIEKGTFNGEVINNGTITGGTFNGTVNNNGTINNGTFNGEVTNNGTINDGTFNTPITGSGTKDDPYQISTAAQLKRFRNIVNGTGGQTQDSGACAVLMNDIVLNDGTFDANGTYTPGSSSKAAEEWTPIGKYTDDNDKTPYTGTFDGQGHTIKGLYVNSASDAYVGLFGCLEGAAVRNLTVDGYVQGYKTAGGIAGYASNAAIENCSNHCSVFGGSDSMLGGIAGLNFDGAKIIDCYNVGTIIRNSTVFEFCGGIVWGNAGTVSNCYNVGTISGNVYDGEIVGRNSGTVENCYYLAGTNLDAVGQSDSYGKTTKTESKTAAEFADGTLLELLKADRNDSPWDSCQYLAAAGKTLPVFKGQGDAHEHNGNWTSNGNGTHSRRCTCNAVETQNCSGGKATCKDKAICEICGDSYGSPEPNNHTDLKHIDAKAATAAEEGNIAYWYCDGCGKYFSDAAATREITQADTVTAKLPQPTTLPTATPTASPTAQPTTAPQAAEQPRRTAQPTVQPTAAPTVQPVSTIPATGDTSSPILWAALLLCSGAGLAVTAYKKNRHRS
ncbi:PT domain-containing protein [uncultured Gemmiger sp.]|uniref:PT domain-containing protein n=1 Tax=uncultured Gemmiger sp. TaxID=1623490 RepID=UPI00266F40F3|nr:PT domain-containing protein [uncultured Gemmiger sp.]